MTTPLISRSERSYIQAALQSPTPIRADGRGLYDYRTIALETGVTPLANGSARVNIGVKNAPEGPGGTEILVAVKLEVENAQDDGASDNGRISCSVICSPPAYPHMSSNALDDLSYDYTDILQQTLSHRSLLPENLTIIPKVKNWRLHLDALVITDAGNVYDALFLASRAALWDAKVPQTRPVEYIAPSDREVGKPGQAGGQDMDVDAVMSSGLDTRNVASTTDFELLDYWEEGEPLKGRAQWPICVTMNLLPPIYFLDSTSYEESAASLKLLLLFNFGATSQAGSPQLQGMRLLGDAEVNMILMKTYIAEGEKHAKELHKALESQLQDEEARRGARALAQFASVHS